VLSCVVMQLEVHQPLTHVSFRRRFFPLDEPPALEDGSSFGRPRHKASIAEDDPHNLEERFYRYGIKPEWMQIHRIVMHESVSVFDFCNIFLRTSADMLIVKNVLAILEVSVCVSVTL